MDIKNWPLATLIRELENPRAKYPEDELMDEAARRLRAVQAVLEGRDVETIPLSSTERRLMDD